MQEHMVVDECLKLRAHVSLIISAYKELNIQKARLFAESVYDFIARFNQYFSLCGMQSHLEQLLKLLKQLEKRLDAVESATSPERAKEELKRLSKALDVVMGIINDRDSFKIYGNLLVDFVFGIASMRLTNLSRRCKEDNECSSLYLLVSNKVDEIKKTILKSSGVGSFFGVEDKKT